MENQPIPSPSTPPEMDPRYGHCVVKEDMTLRLSCKIKNYNKVMEWMYQTKKSLVGAITYWPLDAEGRRKVIVNIAGPQIESLIQQCPSAILRQPIAGKKLLVLDVDKTMLFYCQRENKLICVLRPFLRECLNRAAEHYELVAWSASPLTSTYEKLNVADIVPLFNFILGFDATVAIPRPDRNSPDDMICVKPLEIIWTRFPFFNQKNTIIVDDISMNGFLNPDNFLLIPEFRNSCMPGRDVPDDELEHLDRYLRYLAINCKDFSRVDHRHYRNRHFQCPFVPPAAIERTDRQETSTQRNQDEGQSTIPTIREETEQTAEEEERKAEKTKQPEKDETSIDPQSD